MNPYEEVVINNTQIERVFHPTTPKEELVWHRDEESRVIEVLEPTDWKFQYDNQLPKDLTKGLMLYVSKGSYHRVIPGNSKLKIRITKINQNYFL